MFIALRDRARAGYERTHFIFNLIVLTSHQIDAQKNIRGKKLHSKASGFLEPA